MTIILGIETSCDETSAALVEDGQRILSNVVASQVELHAEYGGVFPELASRAHVETIDAVVQQAITQSGTTLDQVDAIAVTRGPGLVGSLLVGINYAKGMALMQDRPLLGINHLEGHVYSLWLNEPHEPVEFPVLVLIVSGGHTELLLMLDHGRYQHLGGTLDDAAGEAFDKIGRLLGLPYPGGPSIENAAYSGNPRAYRFPRAMRNSEYDFSFSGLKTAVMREVTVQPAAPQRHRRSRGEEQKAPMRSGISVADVAASFQVAVIEALVEKTVYAASQHDVKAIFIAGGVSANRLLRSMMQEATDVPVRFPQKALCTDNAAMIAAAGYFRYRSGLRSSLDMDVLPSWPLNDDTYMGQPGQPSVTIISSISNDDDDDNDSTTTAQESSMTDNDTNDRDVNDMNDRDVNDMNDSEPTIDNSVMDDDMEAVGIRHDDDKVVVEGNPQEVIANAIADATEREGDPDEPIHTDEDS